jgi:hypothetical protein
MALGALQVVEDHARCPVSRRNRRAIAARLLVPSHAGKMGEE